MREVLASAPGKMNLVLLSGRPGPDAYHPLFSVFESIALREYVSIRTQKSPGISVSTVGYTLPTSGLGPPRFSPVLTATLEEIPERQHLAVRAAKALMPLVGAKWGASAAGLALTVHKVIPAAGGLAGGSADAAATLVAINEMWELGLNLEQLEEVGRTLGADVPACLHGGWALGLGRGDQMHTIAPAPEAPVHWWALGFLREGLSTPAVFREFDRLGLGRDELPSALQLAPDEYTGSRLAENLHNDLAPAALALRPELEDVGISALGAGAEAWIISGSGPTVAALAPSEEAAQRIAEEWGVQSTWEGSPLSSSTVSWGADRGACVEQDAPHWLRHR